MKTIVLMGLMMGIFLVNPFISGSEKKETALAADSDEGDSDSMDSGDGESTEDDEADEQNN